MVNDTRSASETRLLAQLLIEAGERAKAECAAAAAMFDLPAPLARALTFLEEPAPMRDLAKRLGCDRSYVTDLADQLEERGLVTRVSGSDRRVKLLALTPAGVELRDKVTGVEAERAPVMRRLDAEQRRSLAGLLGHLLHDG